MFDSHNQTERTSLAIIKFLIILNMNYRDYSYVSYCKFPLRSVHLCTFMH